MSFARLALGLFLLSPMLSLGSQEKNPESVDEAVLIDTLHLREATMNETVHLLTVGSGVQIAVSKGAAGERISIFLTDISLEHALKTICSSHGLWYQKDFNTGVIHVMTVAEFRAGVSTYDEESVEVITIRYPRAEEIGASLQQLFQERVLWIAPQRDPERRSEDISDALNRMDLMAQRATFPIQGGGGGNQRGGITQESRPQSRTNDARNDVQGNTLPQSQNSEEISLETLTSFLAQQEGGSSLSSLSEVRRRPGVVHISAFPESNQLLLRGADRAALERVKDVILNLDRPKPQVLLEVKILDVLLDHESARGVDWLFRDGPGRNPNRVSGGASRGITDPVGSLIETTNPDLSLLPQGSGVDARAALFNFVSDDIRLRLQMLDDDNRVTQLATPNLMVADNEASQVFVGSEETVALNVEVTSPVDSLGNPTGPIANPETERRRIGTMLLITPRIHADKTVTIRILQEESKVGEREVTVNGGFTRAVEERSVTTTAIAHDGSILAIGGLVSERVAHRTRGIPLLQDIPLLGHLFKTTFRVQERHELLVLIRPYVLLAPGEIEPASRALITRLSKHPAADMDKSDLGVTTQKDIPVGDEDLKRRDNLEKIGKSARIWDF